MKIPFLILFFISLLLLPSISQGQKNIRSVQEFHLTPDMKGNFQEKLISERIYTSNSQLESELFFQKEKVEKRIEYSYLENGRLKSIRTYYDGQTTPSRINDYEYGKTFGKRTYEKEIHLIPDTATNEMKIDKKVIKYFHSDGRINSEKHTFFYDDFSSTLIKYFEYDPELNLIMIYYDQNEEPRYPVIAYKYDTQNRKINWENISPVCGNVSSKARWLYDEKGRISHLIEDGGIGPTIITSYFYNSKEKIIKEKTKELFPESKNLSYKSEKHYYYDSMYPNQVNRVEEIRFDKLKKTIEYRYTYFE